MLTPPGRHDLETRDGIARLGEGVPQVRRQLARDQRVPVLGTVKAPADVEDGPELRFSASSSLPSCRSTRA